ncbi:copper resistance CopC family protein [Microbacterium sp. CJ88]|uniref:copper resistance CopC family protein n=1 Tax=Microbacterium sp. CJ88 TaxID=3445672 RepID=UPI003F659318
MPHRTRVLPRLGAALAAAGLLLLGSVVVAAPASAHDALVSTDPAAGTTIAGLPTQLTLTFSGDLLTDPGATQVQVTDASGASVVAGAPVVSGTTVTQPLTPVLGSPGGTVTVLWRVVSSDGHPISDQFAFTVAAAPTAPVEPPPTPTPTVTSATTPAATPAHSESATPAPVPSSEASATPWIILSVVLVAAGGAVLYLLVSRARRGAAGTTPADGAPDDSATGSGPPPGR